MCRVYPENRVSWSQAMSQHKASSPLPVDIELCIEEEPIHIPGLIKPYGVLLALAEPDLTILQVSNNTQELLGIATAALLNRNLDILLGSKQVKALKACLEGDFGSINPLKLSIKHAGKSLLFDGIIHRYDGVVILELEPTSSKQPVTFFTFYHRVKSAIDQVHQATSSTELYNLIAKETRQLTGFDRVMIYQFDAVGAGTVVAENKSESLKESYLGLHYPATDIPNQARRLFALTKVRVIPNIHYQPVEIIPRHHPLTHKPLDLSLSVLRSVSPIHLEYLHNMGVVATMVVAIMNHQQLWGLIACHHSAANPVSYEVRTACEFLGQIMSLELSAQEANDDLDYKLQLATAQANLIESISTSNTLQEGLTKTPTHLLELVGAQGCAICLKDEITIAGQTPALAEIKQVLQWLKTQPNLQENIFCTDALPKVYPAAEAFKAVASGLLVLTLSKSQQHYLLWFRPEVIQTVSWAGNPDDNYVADQTGELKLCPRRSFELWKETVRLQSLPWKWVEIEAAQEFRSALVSLILRQADELAKINLELKRSNTELDAFAYIASHDLKEPLRGIHNYANFLMEDYGDVLEAEGVAKLQTLVRLTQRMENLINSLLHYSRLGRSKLLRQSIDLNEMVNQVIATLKISQLSAGEIDFRLPQPLPVITCDRTQVTELFTNLISNAIKYNTSPQKWIEIGQIEPSVDRDGADPFKPAEITFYVRDNGIGIPEQHLDKIFDIFRRLHAQTDYGGGTGVGLTIARKIAERHGGRIWATSRAGQGSTFYFTLPEEAAV
jgi:two-component system, chemotaxis family, sensor kinase Cph1